jgi:hypothetical protein
VTPLHRATQPWPDRLRFLRGRIARAPLAAAFALALLFGSGPARAHPIVSTDINRHVVITVHPHQVDVDYLYEMLEIAAISAAREADVNGDGRTSEAEHEAQFRDWVARMQQSLQLELDGVPLPMTLLASRRTDEDSAFGLSTVRWNLHLIALLPARGAQGSLVFRDRYRQDLVGWKEIVVQGSGGVVVSGAGASAQDRSQRLTDYAAMAELPNPDEEGVTTMLALASAPPVLAAVIGAAQQEAAPASSPEASPAASAARPSTRMRAAADTVQTAPQQPRASTAASDAVQAAPKEPPPTFAAPAERTWDARVHQDAWPFFRLGAHHIAVGYDHLLFLLGLLLFRQSLARVVGVVTAFTVAHSLTLALAALGWITPPGPLIDALIPVTIAYVGAAAALRPDSRHGPLLAFGFGLVHGFGFAAALREALGLRMGADWLIALASFNLGIEAFQVVAVCLVYPLLRFADRFAWSTSARRLLAFGVMSAGLVWLVERLR